MFTLIIHRSLLAENTSFLLSPNTTQNQEMLNIYSKESLENNYQHIYFFFLKKSRFVDSASKVLFINIPTRIIRPNVIFKKNVILTKIVLSVQVALKTNLCRGASNEFNQYRSSVPSIITRAPVSPDRTPR